MWKGKEKDGKEIRELGKWWDRIEWDKIVKGRKERELDMMEKGREKEGSKRME